MREVTVTSLPVTDLNVYFFSSFICKPLLVSTGRLERPHFRLGGGDSVQLSYVEFKTFFTGKFRFLRPKFIIRNESSFNQIFPTLELTTFHTSVHSITYAGDPTMTRTSIAGLEDLSLSSWQIGPFDWRPRLDFNQLEWVCNPPPSHSATRS